MSAPGEPGAPDGTGAGARADGAESLFRRIRGRVGKAVGDFGMIRDGDRICVGVSGGKDSYALLHALEALRRRAPVGFTLHAVTFAAGYPGFRADVVAEYLAAQGFSHEVETTNAYEVIRERKAPRDGWCSFCARLRRGFLATAAGRAGCNVIALGHHLDDFAETLILNLAFGGSLSAMSAHYPTRDGRFRVIRPLVYVEEADLEAHSRRAGFPVVHCACPAAGAGSKRARAKRLLADLAAETKSLRANLIGALANVRPDRLLDPRLPGFGGPPRGGEGEDGFTGATGDARSDRDG